MPNYKLDFKTESTDAVPEVLQNLTYWYEKSTDAQYDTSNTYAKWTHSTKGVVISTVSDVGNETATLENYFLFTEVI